MGCNQFPIEGIQITAVYANQRFRDKSESLDVIYTRDITVVFKRIIKEDHAEIIYIFVLSNVLHNNEGESIHLMNRNYVNNKQIKLLLNT